MNGLEVAGWLRENDTKALIVFLTGYPEYSLEGYKVAAHRFLIKTDEKLDASLAECLDSAWEKIQRAEKRLELDVQGDRLSIAPSKIVYAEKKIIKMKFVAEDKNIVLSVTNTFASVPAEVDGELLTSKKVEPEEHGIGLKNVKEIIEKYNGIYTVDFDDKWFFVAILIPGKLLILIVLFQICRDG